MNQEQFDAKLLTYCGLTPEIAAIVMDEIRRLREENALLRRDKAVLDWLDLNAVVRGKTLSIMEMDDEDDSTIIRWAGVEWSGTGDDTVRNAVIEGMGKK